MENIHLNYNELAILIRWGYYRKSEKKLSEYENHILEKLAYFFKHSDSEHFIIEQILV